MAPPQPKTVREQIAFAYASLCAAHVALQKGSRRCGPLEKSVWRKFYHGYLSCGKPSPRTLVDDAKAQMKAPYACEYCGRRQNVSGDHLIPLKRGGPDVSDNIVQACRSCNSSKGSRDLMTWAASKGFFPSILVLRRYLKLIFQYCETHDLMDVELSRVHELSLPFDIEQLPTRFPPLATLVESVEPKLL